MLTPPSITEIRRPTTREEEIQKDARTIQAVREPANMRTLADFSAFFHLLLSYRVPMMVRDTILFRHFPNPDIYYHCPRCQRLLDREFMADCDCCGQCLDWRDYRKARRTHCKPKR